MRPIRFSGLVRLANGVQRELSGAVPIRRREQLRSQVVRAIELVDRTLRVHGASLRAIPGPTRRAYEFLRTVDFEQVPIDLGNEAGPVRDSVGLTGIVARVAPSRCTWLG